MRCLEAPAEVPDLVRPLDVGLASRLEVLADIRREVADERVIGHVGHVEPRVGVEFVGQLHHVFKRRAVGERLGGRAFAAGALADVGGVTAVGPGADVGAIRFLHSHEADHAERGEPLLEERVKRRVAGAGLPLLARERLAVPGGHPDIEIAHRVGGARLFDPHVNAVVAGRDGQVGVVAAGGRAARRDRAGVEPEDHGARAIPLGTVGPAGIGAGGIAKHERGGHLPDRLTARVDAAAQAHDVAVGIDADRIGRADIPRHLVGGRVELLGDPAARGLEGVGERPGGRPIDDVFEVHPHPHVLAVGGHQSAGFHGLGGAQARRVSPRTAAFCAADHRRFPRPPIILARFHGRSPGETPPMVLSARRARGSRCNRRAEAKRSRTGFSLSRGDRFP